MDATQYASSLDRFLQCLSQKIQARTFAETKRYEQRFKDFFSNLSFRRRAFLDVKREADILLSSDFNVF